MTNPEAITDNRQDRYPGPRPFDENSRDLFFGRSREIQELIEAISIHQLYMIHGESGLGKSSLINAGLIPRLRALDYVPVSVRFKDRNSSPVKNIKAEVSAALKLEKFPSDLPERHVLWYLLKVFNSRRQIPVLIFDQFEEFSLFKSKLQQEFYEEITTVFSPGRQSLSEFFKSEELRSADFMWHLQPEFKLVFSLRSDKLMVIEDLSNNLPALQRNRYKLKPIQADFSRQLIVLPTLVEDAGNLVLRTKPFRIYAAVIADIVEVTRDEKNNSIETTQMQMICQELELLVKEKQESNGDMPVEITSRDMPLERLKRLISNFYFRQLTKLRKRQDIDDLEFMAIRVLIEQRFVVHQKRTPLAKLTIRDHLEAYFKSEKSKGRAGGNYDQLIRVYKDDDSSRLEEIIDLLLELRIIRDQPYGDTVFYEISHDILVPGILKELEDRESAESIRNQQLEKIKIKEIEKQNRLLEQQKSDLEKSKDLLLRQKDQLLYQKMQLEKEKRRRETISKWARAVIAIALLICLFSVFFTWKDLRTIESKNREMRYLNGVSNVANGLNAYNRKDFRSAFLSFDKAITVYDFDSAARYIDSLLFPEISGAWIETSSGSAVVYSDTPNFSLYDISGTIPKRIFVNQAKWKQLQISSAGNYIFYRDTLDHTNLLNTRSKAKYTLPDLAFEDFGFLPDESAFYYKGKSDYTFRTLDKFDSKTVSQLRFILSLNPIDQLMISPKGGLYYVRKKNIQNIYDFRKSQLVLTLPKGASGFRFHPTKPVLYYFNVKHELHIYNYLKQKEISIKLDESSYVDEADDRLLVKNKRRGIKLIGVDAYFQYSNVINLSTWKIFSVPPFVYKANVVGFSNEKYVVYRAGGNNYLYNFLLKKQIPLKKSSSYFYTDDEKNRVYFINDKSKLTVYDLLKDNFRVYDPARLSKFTINKLRTKVAFQDSLLRIGLIDLTTDKFQYLDYQGVIGSFVGPYLHISQPQVALSVQAALINPDSSLLKGVAKRRYLERILKNRN